MSYGCALAQHWPGATVEVCGFCGLEAAEMLESMDVKEVEAHGGVGGMGDMPGTKVKQRGMAVDGWRTLR